MNEMILSEFSRIIKLIPETDPRSCDYHVLMQSLECFSAMAEDIESLLDMLGENEPEEGKIISVTFRPPQPATCGEDCATCDCCGEEPPISSSNSTESVTAGENQAEKPDSPADETAAETTYDLPTVRAALIEARKRGVDLKPIFKSVGASNLTDLPEEKYGAVMAKLKEVDG